MSTAAAPSPATRCFYILGCQRSGTTLMRLILECHSRIECHDESSAYNVLRTRGRTVERSGRLVGLKVPCLTEQLARPKLWDEFLLRSPIPNNYRGQPLVLMVRDVRSTVASMMRLRLHGHPWFGRGWVDAVLIPTLLAKISKDADFRQRYADEISELKTAAFPKLARAAFYWRYKTGSILDYLSRGFPLLTVRYEDLVERPGVELLKVCGLLGVPWEKELLQHERFAHSNVKANGLTIGRTDPKRPIDGESLSRGRDAFSRAELDEILRFAGPIQGLLYRFSEQRDDSRELAHA